MTYAEATKISKAIKLEINKEVVFSTSHITEATNQILEDNTTLLVVQSTEYNHRVFITDYSLSGLAELDILIKIASDNGCTSLLLDCDGPVYKELDVYDW